MNLAAYILSVSLVVIVFWRVVDLLLRKRMKERHAFWWLVLALFVLVFTVIPGLLDRVASILGIGIPVNLAFFASIMVLFLINTQHSKELTQLEERTRVLAEQVAILKAETKQNNQL